jgi:hypothetical protein
MDTLSIQIIDSKGVIKMKMMRGMALVMMGVGGTLLYQQAKDGNMKKMLKDVKKVSMKTIDDLEDMI